MTAPILRVEGATVRIPGSTHDAVRDVCLDIEQGETVALVGPNGSGKSTTLATLAGALSPREGRVLLAGDDIRSYSRRALARLVARLPQDPATPEGVTVEHVVRFGRHAHSSTLRGTDRAGSAAVERALSLVGVADLRRRTMETLSGGERRRAWLAMILAQEAEVILLDEPTASLNLRHQLELLSLVGDLNRRLSRTVVIVLHDLDHAVQVAHRIVLLHRGRLYRHGPARHCLDADALRDVFGVRGHITADSDEPRLAIQGLADPRRRF